MRIRERVAIFGCCRRQQHLPFICWTVCVAFEDQIAAEEEGHSGWHMTPTSKSAQISLVARRSSKQNRGQTHLNGYIDTIYPWWCLLTSEASIEFVWHQKSDVEMKSTLSLPWVSMWASCPVPWSNLSLTPRGAFWHQVRMNGHNSEYLPLHLLTSWTFSHDCKLPLVSWLEKQKGEVKVGQKHFSKGPTLSHKCSSSVIIISRNPIYPKISPRVNIYYWHRLAGNSLLLNRVTTVKAMQWFRKPFKKLKRVIIGSKPW